MGKPTKKTGSLAINQTMLLVLGVIVLVVLAAFYVVLGERAGEMIKEVLRFPEIE